MQTSWPSKKAEETQSFTDRKDMKKFHDALKQFMVQRALEPPHFLSADGRILLSDKYAILDRWAEYFDSVLNCPSIINDNVINRMPQVECNIPNCHWNKENNSASAI